MTSNNDELQGAIHRAVTDEIDAAIRKATADGNLTSGDFSDAVDRLRARVGAQAEVRILLRPDGVLGVEHVRTVPDAEGHPTIESLGDFELVTPRVAATPPTTPPTGPQPMGDAGYNRLLDLLNNPPLDAPGLPPPGTGIPTDLKEWLGAFKEPLVYMTVDAAMSAVKAKLGGYSRGRLKELYAQMSPADIAAVMQGNAEIVKKFADQKAAEAAMIASITARVSDASANLLFNLLSHA